LFLGDDWQATGAEKMKNRNDSISKSLQ